MAKFARNDIEYGVGRTVLYLIIILSYTIYKAFNQIEYQYIYIIGSCIIGIIISYRIGYLFDTAIASKGEFTLPFVDRLLTSFGLMIILGGLALYIIIYKGFYGVYQLYGDFSWLLLGYKILTIFLDLN